MENTLGRRKEEEGLSGKEAKEMVQSKRFYDFVIA